MSRLFILLLVTFASFHSFAKTFEYIDYSGNKGKIKLSVGGMFNWVTGDFITLEDFNNIKVPLTSEETNLYQSAEIKSNAVSSVYPDMKISGVAVVLGKEAANATRSDLQSMMNSGMLAKASKVEILCPSSAEGVIIFAVRDFGYFSIV